MLLKIKLVVMILCKIYSMLYYILCLINIYFKFKPRNSWSHSCYYNVLGFFIIIS